MHVSRKLASSLAHIGDACLKKGCLQRSSLSRAVFSPLSLLLSVAIVPVFPLSLPPSAPLIVYLHLSGMPESWWIRCSVSSEWCCVIFVTRGALPVFGTSNHRRRRYLSGFKHKVCGCLWIAEALFQLLECDAPRHDAHRLPNTTFDAELEVEEDLSSESSNAVDFGISAVCPPPRPN